MYLFSKKERKHFVTNLTPAYALSPLYSETDEDRQGTRNGQTGKSEFKDEETVTTKSVQIVQATETTATRKRGVPSKTIDLGAAARYTGDKPSTDTNTSQVEKCYSKTIASSTSLSCIIEPFWHLDSLKMKLQ